MGGTKDFKARGEYRYGTVGMLDGIKVIRGFGKIHDSPDFAGDSMIYIRADSGNNVREIIFYDPVTKARTKEVNWTHPHGKYKDGDVHVHDYINGKRSNKARDPNAFERELVTRIKNNEIFWD